MITNMVDAEWMCELCGFQSDDFKKLEVHLKEVHHDFWIAWYTKGDIEIGNDRHNRD